MDNLHYVIKYRDVGIKKISNANMVEMWPELAKKFWEKKIVFQMPVSPPLNETIEERTDEAVGKPLKVIGLTDLGGLQYLCEWSNGSKKMLPAAVTEPDIAVQFFEERSSLDTDQPEWDIPSNIQGKSIKHCHLQCTIFEIH